MELGSAILQFLAVTAIAFAALVVVAAHMRFESLHRVPGISAGDHHTSAMEIEVARMLGTLHREPDPFGVAFMGWDATELHPADVERQVRSCIRRTDSVISIPPNRLGLVIKASREHMPTVLRRVLENVSSAATSPTRFFAGIASCPENGARAVRLIEAAHAALERAMNEHNEPVIMAEVTDQKPRPAAQSPPKQLDALTGVLREEIIRTALLRELAYHRRQETPLTVLLVDIDHLQRYNDHYGRDTGDFLLKEVASFVAHGVRETDLVGRYQGDSFMVIMSASLQQAEMAASRVLQKLRRTPFASRVGPLRVSASIGAAGFPEHGRQPAALIEAAEVALWNAQHTGGARVVLYSPALAASKIEPSDVKADWL